MSCVRGWTGTERNTKSVARGATVIVTEVAEADPGRSGDRIPVGA